MLEAAEFRPTYRSMFHAQSSRRIALVVAGVFGVLGLVGLAVAEGATPHPVVVKGFLFIAACGFVIYAVTGSLTRGLMRAHALLTAVVESIGDGVLILGRDRRIVYANPAAVRMLECRSAANLIGIGAAEFSRRYGVTYMNGALVRPDAFVSQRAFTEQTPLRYRTRISPSPGHEIVVMSVAAAVRARQDEPPAMVVNVMHDITDAENLERDRDHLFAAAAHTLKTPVAVIKANVQHMAAQGEMLREPSVATIGRQCDRIDRLIRNLFVVSRARSKTLEIHVQPVELVPLVHAALKAIPDVPVRADLHGSVEVRADAEPLALAIANLVHTVKRDAVPGAPLTMRLASNAWTVELAVQARLVAVGDRTSVEAGDEEDMSLSECATRTIVEAHGGTTGTEEHDGERTSWIRLPLVGDDDHDRE